MTPPRPKPDPFDPGLDPDEDMPDIDWSVEVNIVTANIGREKSGPFRSSEIARVRDHFPDSPPIIGWQEIDESDSGDEHGMLRKHMPHYAWAGANTREPIGIPPGWTLASDWQVKGHAGMAKFSPYRPIVIGVARHDATGIEVSLVNTHPVRLGPTGGQLAERQDLWDEWKANVIDVIANQHKTGRPVIFCADANSASLGKLHPNQQTLVHSGLDYIIGVDGADARIVKKWTTRVDLHIDGHDAHGVRVELVRA